MPSAAAALWKPLASPPIDSIYYASATIGDVEYYLVGADPASFSCPHLDAYAHDRDTDAWRRLTDGPERAEPLCWGGANAFAHDGDIYVSINRSTYAGAVDPATELYVYHPVTDRWETLPPLAALKGACSAVGLARGLFCHDTWALDTASGPVAYAYFDYAARSWSHGRVTISDRKVTQLFVAADASGEGSTVAMGAVLAGGRVLVARFDPVTGKLGRRLVHRGTGFLVGDVQLTSTGVVYLAPPNPAPGPDDDGGIADHTDRRLNVGQFCDLDTRRCWTVEIPNPYGPLAAKTPSSPRLIPRSLRAQASRFVMANLYLYDPRERAWLAVSIPGPDGQLIRELEDTDEFSPTAFGTCRYVSGYANECWRLIPGALDEITVPITQAQIAASNAQVR